MGLRTSSPLTIGAIAGSFLSAAAIVGLSSTITVWQSELSLTGTQVGLLSGLLSLGIAIGSLAANAIARRVGRIAIYRMALAFAALGFAIAAMAPNFTVLLAGVIITAVTTGVDLPVALSLVSETRYTGTDAARQVSLTQSGWQLGIFAVMILAFTVSWFPGNIGCRAVYIFLTLAALATSWYRCRRVKFEESRGTHECSDSGIEPAGKKQAFWKMLTKRDAILFMAIVVFYVFWNFLGNTWGQFQTFIFVNAHATQSLATGVGIVICFVTFLASLIIPMVSGTRFENPLFYLGGLLTTSSLLVLAFQADQLVWLIVMTGFLNTGLVFAGEAASKVWIQTSFADAGQRTAIQGFVLAVSRICCSLLALVTPLMVMPSTIKLTMLVFFGFALISFAAGLGIIMMRRAKDK